MTEVTPRSASMAITPQRAAGGEHGVEHERLTAGEVGGQLVRVKVDVTK